MPLTHERAIFRSEHIKKGSISYNFHISVEAGTHYTGVSELHFELLEVPEELPIDFIIQEINKIVVNGNEITLKKEDGFILIEKGHLKKGAN
jgi:hypothetical protein